MFSRPLHQEEWLLGKQYEVLDRKIKWDLLNFRGVQNGYYQDFQYLMVSIRFFMKWQRQCKVLCMIN